jgi:hypothetical protein
MKLPLPLDRDAGEMMRERGSEVNCETARRKGAACGFPEDFMFQLDAAEPELLRSQFVTSSWGAAGAMPLTPSSNRAWRCSPRF